MRDLGEGGVTETERVAGMGAQEQWNTYKMRSNRNIQ